MEIRAPGHRKYAPFIADFSYWKFSIAATIDSISLSKCPQKLLYWHMMGKYINNSSKVAKMLLKSIGVSQKYTTWQVIRQNNRNNGTFIGLLNFLPATSTVQWGGSELHDAEGMWKNFH